jgi:hypothetical protein
MPDLADDLLWGAGSIAKALFGLNNKKTRRKVYHLHQEDRLPIWKDGPDIISRKSLLDEHYRPPKQAAE